MIKLLFIITIFSSDSVVVKQDSTQHESIVFKKDIPTQLETIKYRHSQGFFCDFEDRINKERKLNLNLGVGNQ